MRVAISALTYGLAWYAAVNLAASLVSWLLARRVADRVIADARRSRRLLAIRFLPAALSGIVSIALFVPAHLRLEPAQTGERVGLLALALAVLGAGLLLHGVARAVRLLMTSSRLARLTRISRTAGSPLLHEVPLLHGIALAGVLNPRVIIGSETRRVLTPPELEVAVAHELAHRRAMDNLTRLLLLCAPDLFGYTAAARRIERLWDAQAECLADARAVDGHPDRASSLASALVKVARCRAAHVPTAMAWSTFHQPVLLETRVRLLVDRVPDRVRDARGLVRAAAIVAVAITAAWASGAPRSLHLLTEFFVATLP